MQTVAPGISYIDLHFQGQPRVIATAVFAGTSGVALIDPGPSSTLPALERALAGAGLGVSDVTDVLLTHIHLDHAGSTGTLLRRNPRIRVRVHERGAPHLVDPSKLVASASRLYGDAMDRLWGEVLPVPAQAITSLSGGERVGAGARLLDVAATPGHAVHHVSYFSDDSGIAFVGDTAGIKIHPEVFVLPPTPPPDIDLDAWRSSLALVAAWRPSTLFVTHFGPWGDASAHLSECLDRLEWVASLARQSLALEMSDEEREAWFGRQVRHAIGRQLTDADTSVYETAARFDLSWRGLARYWRKNGL